MPDFLIIYPPMARRRTRREGSVMYGIPYRCPKCRTYYGHLKLPSVRLRPCPHCQTRLVPSHADLMPQPVVHVVMKGT